MTEKDGEGEGKGGMKRKGEKEKVKMNAKLCHACFSETRYTQECIPRNKVTLNLTFPASHKIGIMFCVCLCTEFEGTFFKHKDARVIFKNALAQDVTKFYNYKKKTIVG